MFPLVQKIQVKVHPCYILNLTVFGHQVRTEGFYFMCYVILLLWLHSSYLIPSFILKSSQFHGFINHTSQKNFTSSTANLVWHLNLLVQRIPSFSKKFTKNENYLSGGFTIIRRLQWFHGEKPFVINSVWDFCADLSCFCSKSSCCVFILAFLYNWFTQEVFALLVEVSFEQSIQPTIFPNYLQGFISTSVGLRYRNRYNFLRWIRTLGKKVKVQSLFAPCL